MHLRQRKLGHRVDISTGRIETARRRAQDPRVVCRMGREMTMVRTKAVGLKSGSRAITVPIRQVGYGVQRQGGELNRRRATREN